MTKCLCLCQTLFLYKLQLMNKIIFTFVILFLVATSFPAICADKNPVCVSKSTGAKMKLSEARKIAVENCKEGAIKKTFMCNEITGIWWLDFNPVKKTAGCNPACVVDVNTKQSEINWRCTGILK